MLNATEPPRVHGRRTWDDIRRLVRTRRPFIVEQADNPAFQRIASSLSMQRFRSVFGDRPWRVRRCERDRLDLSVPFAAQTELMPFSAFLDRIHDPDDRIQYYVNIPRGPELEFAKEMFDPLQELEELGPDWVRGYLRGCWLGGAGNVTPLHYDRYALWHGVVHGRKVFHVFPPDLRHYINLAPYPLRSPSGWHSRIGAGPLDSSVFPQLKKTRPLRATLAPGDFVYLPPCWWHYVTIPDEPTISISANAQRWTSLLQWYQWRSRLADWLGGQKKLFWRIHARKRADWAPSEVDGNEANAAQIRRVQNILLYERYFTEEQLETLRARRERAGENRLHEVQAGWRQIFEELSAARAGGAGPSDQRVQALAHRARALIAEFIGDDPVIRSATAEMYRREGGAEVMAHHGVKLEPGLWKLLSESMAHSPRPVDAVRHRTECLGIFQP